MEAANIWSIIIFVMEITVLILIFREIRELRRHQSVFEDRLKNVNPKTIKYVAATRAHILKGNKDAYVHGGEMPY